MNTIKFYEHTNPEITDKLARLPFETYKSIIEGYKGEVEENEDDLKTQYFLLRKYCLLQKKAGYKLERTYTKSKTARQMAALRPGGAEPNGRWFVEDIGIQRINALFRGILCAGNYYDYDMINAHPVLLCFIMKTHSLSHGFLRQYVDNREKILKDLMSELGCEKWEAKLLFIKSMNSDSAVNKFNKKKIKNAFFIEFDKEMKYTQKELEVKNSLLKTQLHKAKRGKYHSGHLLNYLCCDLENTLLEKVMDKMRPDVERPSLLPGSNQRILMYDGFMCNLSYRVEELNDITKEYGIEWQVKPLDDSILEEVMESPDDVYSSVGDDIVELGKNIINELFKGRIKKSGDDLYIKEDGIWKSGRYAQSVIKREIQDADLWMAHPTKPDKLIKISKIPNYIRDMSSLILDAQVPQDDEWIDEVWEGLKGKLCFKNGYYDFDAGHVDGQGKFVEGYEDVDTFFTAPMELNMESNEEVRKEIYEKIIAPIWTIKEDRPDFEDRCALYNCIMYELAVSLAHSKNKENKNWLLIQGDRNSGKGVQVELLTNALGRNYVKPCEGGNFRMRQQTTGADAAKANHWYLEFRFARLAVVSEMIFCKQGGTIDGAQIKKFRSGGDYIEARRNHHDNEFIRHQAGLMFACNDWGKVEPADAMRTCIEGEMMSQFVDADSEVLDKDNTMTSYFVKEEEIKSVFCRRPDVLNEWMLMLIEAFYKPVKMPQRFIEQNEDTKDDENDEDKLIARFEADSLSHITYEQLRSYLIYWKNGLSQRKATRAICNHFGIKPGEKNSKGQRGLKGIKVVLTQAAFDDDEEED
jgi:hypothetical protein